MLMRSEPLRDFDRLADSLWGTRPPAMPMTAYRDAGNFVVHLDLPGVNADDIDLTAERNVLTVRAERQPPVGEADEHIIDERSYGVLHRQLILSDSLDADRLTADYDAGVLTIKIPVAEQAQPRKIEITDGSEAKALAG